jgi:hypothetical protein
VLIERTLGGVAAPERAIRERQRVVCGAVLGEEGDGAFEMGDSGGVAVARRGDSTEAEFSDRLRRRLAAERVVERLGAIEIARLDERLGQLRARRQVAGRAGERFVEARGGFGVAGEPLQRDAVEVQPFGVARRQRVRAQIGVVRRAPLIPGVQRAGERADRADVGRARDRGGVRARDRVARLRRKRVEVDPWERRERCLRGGDDRRADADDSKYQKVNLRPRRTCRSG